MKLRNNNLKKLGERTFDVLIMGGGINGATAAAALAARGISVALVEKKDFASFTSQESSNLIWGGIKYLETGEARLVRKLCMSRNHLRRSYPSTIKEIRFFTSLARDFRWPPVFLYLGSWIYWLIGNGFTKPPKLLTKLRIQKKAPVVNTDNLKGGIEYSDCYLVDNDARFVFNFIRTALDHGAICTNYVRVKKSTREEDGTWQTVVEDGLSQKEFSIKSRAFINASGPYVDANNAHFKVETLHRHVFSKGIHLVVKALTGQKKVLTFFADDGRLFFVIPMGPRSCIGTTDTKVEKLPAKVTDEDRRFVLDNINKRLNLKEPLEIKDIIAERCGVRPLVVTKKSGEDGGKDWTSLSRKHEIEADLAATYMSIFGGKLTDCLNIGDEVTKIVKEMGILPLYPKAPWYGEPAKEVAERFYHQARLMKLDELTSSESSEALSSRLWRRYGRAAFELLEDIREDPDMAKVLIEGAEYIRCELHQAAHREMITKLEDFLRRRSKIALITPKAQLKKAPGLMEACEILFGKEAQDKFSEYFEEA